MFKNTGRGFVLQITLFSKQLGPALQGRSTSQGIVFLEISIDASKFSSSTRSHFELVKPTMKTLISSWGEFNILHVTFQIHVLQM